MQTETKPTFPLLIRKGHATVKIYRMKQRGGWNYAVAFVTPTGRTKRNFSDLELAKREANTIAANLAGGDLEALKLTGRERQLYVAANEAIAHTGISLDVVAREFAAAFDILGRDGIIEAARYFKKRAEAELPAIRVADGVARFIAAKEAQGISAHYRKDLRLFLKLGLAEAFHCNISAVTADDLRDYLNGLSCGPVAKNNRRRVIVAFFNFAKGQRWLPPDQTTAADAQGAYKVIEKDVTIYTPDEMAKLLAHADEGFLPWVALIGFGGVRHEEIHKGLKWESIDFAKGTLIVPGEIAKTGKKRKVDLPDNLREWLAPYAGRRGPIFAADPDARIQKLSKAAGVPWKRNALRHSFGSYRMEATKNAGQVSLEMGNSAAVVLAHYFEIVDAAAATTYWSLRPAEGTTNIVPMGVASCQA